MGDRGHNYMGRKEGDCCAPFAGAGTASNTVWPGPGSTSIPSGVFIHPAVWPQQTRAKNWVSWVCLFSWGSWVRVEHKVACAEAYLHTKWHHSPSSLATTDVGRKLGACAPLEEGDLGPHLAQCGLDQGLLPCQVPS